MKNLITAVLLISLISCNTKPEKAILQKEDYNKYLHTDKNLSLAEAQKNKDFWSKRIGEDSTKITGITKLAPVHNDIFNATGNVEELYVSEKLIKKALSLAAKNKDDYLRSLAHNYISQHRFKEAKTLLDTAYTYNDNKYATELMLFDISMELGKYKNAEEYLKKIKDNGNYNYLIRLSKWSDYKGNLDGAINYMEKAVKLAESSGDKSLKVWSYSNLGDFYGHAGRIDDSYNYYLKTLALDPDNAYAKKGLAWIAYSFEKDTEEANRILDSVMVNHKSPDYYLLKAEMAEFNNDATKAENYNEKFLTALSENDYKGMYNAYLIEYYAENNPEKAVELAKEEVNNRATPETYSLLALAQLKAGNKEEALKAIEQHVEGKTFEPMAQYYSALVYKANGQKEKVKPIKEELSGASYEMGPVLSKKIAQL